MTNILLQKIEKVYEDSDLLVINKPAGIIVNTSETTIHETTLTDWLRGEYGDLYDLSKSDNVDFSQRCGIVHRLDKDTSGLLIIAKNSPAFTNLQQQFKDRLVNKKYLALVHGFVSPKEGTISAPIERNPFNRKRFGVFLSGRDSVTDYKVKNFYKSLLTKENYSQVEVNPKTGRTHQIRVHFTHIGHPLVSDILYSGRKNYQKDIKFCPRLFLHAYQIRFKQPIKNVEVELIAKLPNELQQVLDSLLLQSD